MSKIALKVMGMSCKNCAKAINEALDKTDGVSSCEVDLPGKLVTVEFNEDTIQKNKIIHVIDDLGYEVVR
ncbi:MAG: cation transporter [Deferribacteraceae bacterium]|nr:cation transporter [Deferribacteraceae bacterium]